MYHLGEYDQEITSEIKMIVSVQILSLNEKIGILFGAHYFRR